MVCKHYCDMLKVVAQNGKFQEGDDFIAYTVPAEGFDRLVGYAKADPIGNISSFHWVHKDFRK